MTPRNAEIIRLRKEENLSYTDIAELLGISRNAVAGVLHRAGLCLTGPNREYGATTEFKRLVVAEIPKLGWDGTRRKHGVSGSTLSQWRRDVA